MERLDLRELARGLLARDLQATFLSVAAEPLRGGISAAHVAAVRAAYRDADGRPRSASWVVKGLAGPARREAGVYRWLARHAFAYAPRLVAALADGDRTWLVLERVVAAERWPWRDTTRAEDVLRAAAALHEAALVFDDPWDYEGELSSMAAATLDAVAAARRSGALPLDAASLRALRRVVHHLPAFRRALLRETPFPPALVHGDLHPGNVIVARAGGALAPRLLDWGRARRGAPLEDVASWIQSLGCWEPAARLRHDTLLTAYLRARGGIGGIPAEVREAYWLAGASNALAGAMLHHAGVAVDPAAARPARARAAWALHDWLRITRRAAAVWGAAAASGARARRTPLPGPGPGPTGPRTETRSPGDTRSSARS
jgi:aminoglycoside phosphotransferase (APT) family kinase protein